MNREFKPFLTNRLNQLSYQGYAIFERWELLSWYGKERITNVVWRDINEAWEGLFAPGEQPHRLLIIKCDDSNSVQKFVIINKNQLIDIEKMW